MPPEVMTSSESPETVDCDALLIGLTQDGRARLDPAAAQLDEAFDGYLLQHVEEVSLKGKIGDLLFVPTFGRVAARSIAIVGVGDEADLHSLRRAAGIAARRLTERSVVASLLHCVVPSDGSAAAVAEGFLLGSYRFTTYKTDPHPSKIQRLVVLAANSEPSLQRAVARAEATMLARDLTNEPPSTLSPEHLAVRAREVADIAGLECSVLEEEVLREQGFGGILGVGRGSRQPPRLILLRYSPERPKGKMALVGKGITFDSGGLSLKPAPSMEQMKTDMAGAAAVIGALSICEQLDVATEVLGIVAAAENMPGAGSMRPGDVLRHYGGKTSEVVNTDAEGRLVLADALAYASEQGPDVIIDVATLTGAIKVALGAKATGVFSNDDELAGAIEKAAEDAGERVWRMPIYDDYLKELDSDTADFKNSGSRWGGSIIAACFLQQFVAKGIPWAHLDIAGAARADNAYDEVAKGGTGVATRTLVSFLEAQGGPGAA